jgi:hypothetical protein
MRALKERGLSRELAPLIKRVKRAYAMNRISKADCNYLLSRLEEVEARIVSMTEIDETGEEVLEPDAAEEAITDRDPG